MSSYYLPEELVEQILMRVPIIPLLRFTTVCKRWYNLLCSPEFIHAHLNINKLRINNSSRYLLMYSESVDQSFEPKYKQYYVVCSDGGNLENFVNLEFPIDGFVEKLRVIGCCNGLVCVPVICSNSSEQVIMLWNPMIRRFFRVPKSDVESSFGGCHLTFGFVFDRVKSDYKVLRIYYRSLGRADMVEIFRLSTGLWEVVSREPPFAFILTRSDQVDLEGIAHWVGKDDDGKLKIVSFDTHEEVFGSIELPAKEGNYDFYPARAIHLFVFEKSLFMVELSDNELWNPFRTNDFCIWRMNEYGVVESWTKLLNCVFDRSVCPLGFRMNGEFLWRAWSPKLISTNLQEGLHKDLTPSLTAAFSSCSHYVESLVLLDQPISDRVPVSTFEKSPKKRKILSEDEFVN